MAGNRRVFEEAMRAAANAAWEGAWGEAVEAYKRALTEFPDDLDGLTGLGAAYLSAERPAEALEIYRRAREVAPDDPVHLEQVGRALQMLGRGKDAARVFLACGKQTIDEEQTAQVGLRCLEAAARLDPEWVDARVALLRQHEREGRMREAAEECLALAGLYRDRGRVEYAVRICEHALQISPGHPDARRMLHALRDRGESSDMDAAQRASEARRARETELRETNLFDFEASEADEVVEQQGSPVDVARWRALRELAESVFEEQGANASRAERLSKRTVDVLIGKAVDLQTRGKTEEAIEAYEKVIDGQEDRPAVRFNLGLLYQDEHRFDEAVAELRRSVGHLDYKLGSRVALGECYRARGRMKEALEQLIKAVRMVDLGTVEDEQADDLIEVYEQLDHGDLVEGNKGGASELTASLLTFLNAPGWEERARAARERLEALARQGPVVSLVEALNVRDPEGALRSLEMSQEYVERGLLYTAMEECHLALESRPSYVPIHWQLAEVCLAMGKVEEAVEKLVVIADTYRVRGRRRQAAAMYEQALKLAPMNTGVRAKLIDYLIVCGEVDRALEHYCILGDSYTHLAELGRAREVYEEALRLAARGDGERDWTVRILHEMGDIDMQRVDWRRAASVYERIRDRAPDDERARLSLMELYYRLDQPQRAIRELDGLLDAYRESGRWEHLFTVLNDLVERWPDRIPLRARIAQAHLDRGSVEEALKHLDRLGDLQLSAGREEEAKTTMRAIIALDPPDVGDYKRLLESLEAGEWAEQ
ncbi:MAG: tetratricopeptide repeat protein [Chloroflexota bacterium]|nr:tetratricopeptide repeat protein [Chloroflexota bacterium]